MLGNAELSMCSNLERRVWSSVSPASSDSNVVRGVVNASAHNVVQSILRRFIQLSQRGVQVCVHDVRFRKIDLRGRGASTFIQCSVEGIFEQRSEGNMLGRNRRSNVWRLEHSFLLDQKWERLVNFLYVSFSLCKTKTVELIEVSVVKNVVCSGFIWFSQKQL